MKIYNLLLDVFNVTTCKHEWSSTQHVQLTIVQYQGNITESENWSMLKWGLYESHHLNMNISIDNSCLVWLIVNQPILTWAHQWFYDFRAFLELKFVISIPPATQFDRCTWRVKVPQIHVFGIYPRLSWPEYYIKHPQWAQHKSCH